MATSIQVAVPGGIQSGLYTFFVALIRPESLLDNSVNGGDVIAVDFRQVLLLP